MVIAALAGTAVIYALEHFVLCHRQLLSQHPGGHPSYSDDDRVVMTLPGDLIKIAISVLLAKRLAPVMKQKLYN